MGTATFKSVEAAAEFCAVLTVKGIAFRVSQNYNDETVVEITGY